MKSFKKYLMEKVWDELEDITNSYPNTNDADRLTFNAKRKEIEHSQKYTPTPIQRIYARNYTGAGYDAINKSLHGNNISGEVHEDDKILPNSDEHSKISILNHIASSVPAHDDFYVYTGLAGGHLEHALSNGGYVHSPALVSSSILPTVAGQYASSKCLEGQHAKVLRIKIKKGQQVGAFIGNISMFPHENEFLLGHNNLLQIKNRIATHYDSVNNWNDNNPVRVYDAEILDPHEIPTVSNNEEVNAYHSFKNNMGFLKTPSNTSDEDLINDLHTTSDRDKLIHHLTHWDTQFKTGDTSIIHAIHKSILDNNPHITKDMLKDVFVNGVNNGTHNSYHIQTALQPKTNLDDIKDIIDRTRNATAGMKNNMLQNIGQFKGYHHSNVMDYIRNSGEHN